MESVKELKKRIQELENEISKKIEKQNQVYRERNPSLQRDRRASCRERV